MKLRAPILFTILGTAGVATGGFQTSILHRQEAALTRLEDEIASRRQRLLHQRLDALRRAPTEPAPALESSAKSWSIPATGDAAFDENLRALLLRIQWVKTQLARDPRQQIPELRYLPDAAWFEVLGPTPSSLDSDLYLRGAFASLRRRAMREFAPILASALRGYLKATAQKPPSHLTDLKPHFVTVVDDALLARYEVRNHDPAATLRASFALIATKASAIVDPEWEQLQTAITANGKVVSVSSTEALDDVFFASDEAGIALAKALGAFQRAHGRGPSDAQELAPYFEDKRLAERYAKWEAAMEKKKP